MEAFLREAKDPQNIEYVLTVNEDEAYSLPPAALAGWGAHAFVKEGVVSPISAYNAAASVARGDILMTVSDDYFPPPGWDEQVRQAIPDVEQEAVLDVNNSDGSTWLIPFPIVTRKYYQRYGYLLYPGYHGLCADNEFTEQARRDRVVLPARHIVFEHHHPERGLAPMDDVYASQKQHYEAAKKLFSERQARGFPKWPD